MSTKTKYLCLLGIFIIAGFFRFYHLTTTPPGLFMDEAMDGVNAQDVAQTGQFKVYYSEDNGREGLYVNILAIAFKYHLLPDTAPWSVRFPAAVAGTLTVLGLYFLVDELFRERMGNGKWEMGEQKQNPQNNSAPVSSFQFPVASLVALLSAFFLAVSFWHVNFSRIGFRAILAPFCLVWAMYFLLKGLRARKALYALCFLLSAGIIYGAGFYTYIAFRITPLLLLLFIPFFCKQPAFWKRMFLFLVVTFLIALPIGWYYLKHPSDFFGRTSQISAVSSSSPLQTVAENIVKTALMFNWHGDYNWRQNFAGAPELFFPVGILFIIGIIFGLYFLFSRRSRERGAGSGDETTWPLRSSLSALRSTRFPLLFMFSWFILGALPEVLSDEGIPHALRSILMVVPAMFFAALGGIWLYGFLRKRWNATLVKTLAVLFLIIVGAGGYYQYFIAWAKNPNVPGAFNANYVAAGEQINALPSGTQKYVVIYAGGVVDYGLPMPAEPVLYITHSFVPDATAQKDMDNIHYLLPDETNQIPAGTPSSTIFKIK